MNKLKALIIGAAGFVGNYLISHLQNDRKWSLSITKLPDQTILKNDTDIYDLDILNIDKIINLLNEVRPDYIFHLAAQSSVSVSWKNPTMTVDINVNGTINLLDAIRTLNHKPKTLLIGSSEEYGRIKPQEIPVNEQTILRPGNIYAVTKAAQNMIGQIYSNAYDMDIVMVRAFNHIGPNQSSVFVVSDFCKQVAEIEANKKEPIIYVGNISAKRDFTDVRDVVRAYSLLIEHGKKGEIYNVGSANSVSIEQVLNIILSMSKEKISIKVDDKKLRPLDVPEVKADIEKLVACTGWKKTIPLETTIADTLSYWRKNV